ncbi:hypothetical protein ABMD26_000540 [Pseudomonas sp. PvP001]
MTSTQPISTSVKTDINANAMRQPMKPPSQVPRGTPSDSAIGVPIIATASARPCSCGTTMRRAYPAIKLQARPADTPAKNLATKVSA